MGNPPWGALYPIAGLVERLALAAVAPEVERSLHNVRKQIY
jgi:hypothetical protein